MASFSCSNERRERPRGLGQARESPWADQTPRVADGHAFGKRITPTGGGGPLGFREKKVAQALMSIRIGDAMATGASPLSDPGAKLSLARGSLYLESLPDQLRDPVLRAGLHPVVREHGRLPDVLHEPRADGLLPGDVGRLPGGVAARRLHQRGPVPLALGGRPRSGRCWCSRRSPTGWASTWAARSRRRDLLRHRASARTRRSSSSRLS